MAEEHKHHHHHHHKKDGATLFKQKSLAAIQQRKLIEKILKIATVITAILMAVAVVLAYTIG
jgi:hypothetical protein